MSRVAGLLHLPSVLIASVALLLAAEASLPDIEAVTMRLAEPSCAPGECVCAGSFEPDTWLQWHGPQPGDLEKAVACIAADFDGDGIVDHAIPGGEGLATIVLGADQGPPRVVLLDAGGILEPYERREEPGPHGEPASDHPGILVRHVGPDHVVFLWVDGSFQRRTFSVRESD